MLQDKENICDMETTFAGLMCHCDSLTAHDATEATCHVFETLAETDKIWQAFGTLRSAFYRVWFYLDECYRVF